MGPPFDEVLRLVGRVCLYISQYNYLSEDDLGSFVTVYSIHHVINTRLCAMYWWTATRVTAHACAYAATRTRNRFDHDAVYSAYPMLTKTQVPGDEDRVCGRDLDLRSGLSIGSRQHHFDCWLAVFPSSLVEVTINRVAPLVPSFGRRLRQSSGTRTSQAFLRVMH